LFGYIFAPIGFDIKKLDSIPEGQGREVVS
jgi:hypothetical protein